MAEMPHPVSEGEQAPVVDAIGFVEPDLVVAPSRSRADSVQRIDAEGGRCPYRSGTWDVLAAPASDTVVEQVHGDALRGETLHHAILKSDHLGWIILIVQNVLRVICPLLGCIRTHLLFDERNVIDRPRPPPIRTSRPP